MARISFDLDGTLVDSAPDLQANANALLFLRGRAPISLAETRSYIGQGTAVFVARMRKARDIPDTEQASLLSDFMGRYETAVDLTTLYPAVETTLAALRRRSIA